VCRAQAASFTASLNRLSRLITKLYARKNHSYSPVFSLVTDKVRAGKGLSPEEAFSSWKGDRLPLRPHRAAAEVLGQLGFQSSSA
jgi:hypothetical protein